MSARKLAIYEDDTLAWHLIEADALLTLTKLPDQCVDAIVTDPPYGIGIVGAHWDGRSIRRAAGAKVSAPEAFECWTRAWAEQCRRVLKPGGHLLSFGAPRTFHRLVCGIEDAGLEVRDQVWLKRPRHPEVPTPAGRPGHGTQARLRAGARRSRSPDRHQPRTSPATAPARSTSMPRGLPPAAHRTARTGQPTSCYPTPSVALTDPVRRTAPSG